MSQRLERFWQALELVPDLAAVRSEWRSLLKDEYELVRRFLLPTRYVARSIRSTAPGRTCIHEIRKWKGEYLCVCPEGCDTVPLPREEVFAHRLDVVALGREIAAAMELQAVKTEQVPSLNGVWRVADYVPFVGYRFPVYLTFTGEPDQMNRAIGGLAARGEPVVLLAPSRSALSQASADLLKRNGSSFLPLADVLGEDDGHLALLDGLTPDSVLDGFRVAHVPQPKADDGIVFFPTPPGAQWEDVSIRFTDSHSVYISVGGVSGTYHFAQMGMANRRNAMPTVQWKLLEAFAQERGVLNWSSAKADRKNQKRKELLAANLQRFFRIDGDPFALEGNGWRARFSVSLRE